MGKILHVIAALTLWGVVAFIILQIDPELIKDIVVKGVYLPLAIAVFLATFYTIWLIFSGVLIAVAIGGLVILALELAVANIMNVFLACVIIAMISFEIFLQIKS